jgi:hypothetical protein
MFIFIPGSSFDLEIHIHFSMSDISYHLPWYWSDLFLPDHRSVIFRKVSRRFWNLLLICAFSDAFLRNLKAPKTTLYFFVSKTSVSSVGSDLSPPISVYDLASFSIWMSQLIYLFFFFVISTDHFSIPMPSSQKGFLVGNCYALPYSYWGSK